MAGLRALFKRLLSPLGRGRWESDLDDEIQFHIDMETRRHIERGLSPADARREAMKGFGGVEMAKETYRDQKGLAAVETLKQDVSYGLRMLVKHRGVTAVAVLTLALGIGANTAIFSVINDVLLKPLPYDGSDRIVMVWEDFSAQDGREQEWIELPNFYEWRTQTDVWEALSAFSFGSANLTSIDEPERLSSGVVTWDFFDTFAVNPILGRKFVPEDDGPDSEPVTILSHGIWQRAFGGRADIIGRSIELDGVETTVIGVLPAHFKVLGGPPTVDVWVPLAVDPARQHRGNFFMQGIGRLREGVSVEKAQAEMNVIMDRIGATYEIDRGVKVSLVPLLDQLVEPIERGLWLLLGIVVFVLAIACANIANLLLSRGAARSREMAIRSAMGASGGRIVRQLLTESVLLALVGAIFGVALAYYGVQALTAQIPASVAPRIDSVQLDSTVLLFTLGVSVLAGLAFGLAPAFQSRRTDVNDTLKEGGRGANEGSSGSRLRAVLAAGQVALALCLLISSGLALRSFQSLLQVDPGFRSRDLMTSFVSMPGTSYAGAADLVNFLDALVEGLNARPGVESVTAVSILPLAGLGDSDTSFAIEGAPEPATPAEKPTIWYRRVMPDYFRTMGIPVLKGRAFDERDHPQAPGVVVISDVAAERYWPGQDPVGRRVRFGGPERPWHTIVGLVKGVRARTLDREPQPELYFPFAQRPGRSMTLIVQSRMDEAAISEMLRADVSQLDPKLPVSTVVSMSSLMERSVSQQRFFMGLTTAFGLLALTLAAVGIYGVVSYSVSRRASEMGIRMALGAGRGEVLGLIVRQGLIMTAVGVATGLVLAFWGTSLMERVLFEISPTDTATFAIATGLLLAIAMAACLMPALRATRIDPIRSLRAE